jgi:DNA repair protein RadC
MEAVKNYIVSEIKVAYHPARKMADCPTITISSDALIYMLDAFDRDTMALQEQFVVMYLNRSNRILGMYKASIGGITGTVADPRIILGIALKIAAVSLIMAHNHPSGSLQPSKADEELTSKVKEAGRFMDIKLLDHLIVEAKGGYYSFADEGILI